MFIFRAKIEEDTTDKENTRPDYELRDEDDKICRNMFVSLQYLAAISGSLGHGGNDVGNCIGPLVTVWLIYQRPVKWIEETSPWYILFYGGAGIAIGLWLFGRRVIKTIGTNLSSMSPSRGFVSDFAAAVIVLSLGFSFFNFLNISDHYYYLTLELLYDCF